MKMRAGKQTGFLLCGKEWTDGESFEVRSPGTRAWLAGSPSPPGPTRARRGITPWPVCAALVSPQLEASRILETCRRPPRTERSFAQLIVAEAGKPVRWRALRWDRAALTFKTAAEESAGSAAKASP